MASSPLLCPPEQKAEREAENTLAQLDYLTELVLRQGCRELRESHVLELQRIAVEGIYPCGGQYRDARFDLEISDSEHKPPPAAMVRFRVCELIDACNRKDVSANVRMAYALWFFNWVHPFPGGNGRTARAIAYLILCMDMNRMVPGVPTMPKLIADDRDGYIDVLRAVDRAYKKLEGTGEHILDHPQLLRPMIAYLDEKLLQQILAAMPSAVRPIAWLLIRPLFLLARP